MIMIKIKIMIMIMVCACPHWEPGRRQTGTCIQEVVGTSKEHAERERAQTHMDCANGLIMQPMHMLTFRCVT